MPTYSPLATADTLTATQIPGRVVLKASGFKPTPGHEVRFEQGLIEVFPPVFSLLQIPPTGTVNQVITPFETDTFFAATEPVASVKITDARGTHEVPVDQAQD